jgi:hypothetical protein
MMAPSSAVAGAHCAALGFDGPLFATGSTYYALEAPGIDDSEDDHVEGRDGTSLQLAYGPDCDTSHDVYFNLGYISEYKIDTDDLGMTELGPVLSLGVLYEHKLTEIGPVPLMARAIGGLHSIKPSADYEDLLEALDDSEHRRFGVYMGGGVGTRHLFELDSVTLGVGGNLGLAWNRMWLIDFDDQIAGEDWTVDLNTSFIELRLGIEGRIHF